MQQHFVYIIKSQLDGSYYKGYSTDPWLRLQFHNLGKSICTSKKLPWKLVAVFQFETKAQALEKEKKIKKYGKQSLEALIASEKNQLYKGNFENR